jgi:nucleoside-diphosphate-sugar epimerase
MIEHLFCFGFSYSANYLIRKLNAQEIKISSSLRSKEKLLPINVTGYLIDDLYQNPALFPKNITHILISIPPINGEDIILNKFLTVIKRLPNLKWVGYLSSTGVYGDANGGWVTEDSPTNPIEKRSTDRLKIEIKWQDLSQKYDLPLHIFRLSGIYGPGRSVIEQLLAGTAKRIDKSNHFFSRIHVEDIADILFASMNQPTPGEIYNLADDFPSSQKDVIEWACEALNLAYPELITIDNTGLSEMIRSFYNSSRKVSNNKVKTNFKYSFKYPSYKEGLESILTSV